MVRQLVLDAGNSLILKELEIERVVGKYLIYLLYFYSFLQVCWVRWTLSQRQHSCY